jgi:hypothetical protein
VDLTRRRRSFSLRFARLTAIVASAAVLPAMLAVPGSQASAVTRPHARPAGKLAGKYRPPNPQAGSAHALPHAAASRAALARARATGRPVVVAPDTTSTAQTVANPDGTFTDTINALPVRVRQHGTWVPVSTRLVRRDGTLSPAAVTEPVTLSAGGTGPLAVLHGLTLWFPGRLPAPRVSGATAIYSSARRGIDLRLTATTTGGVTQTLVVRTAAAAASSWLRRFTERYAITGGQAFSAAPPAVTFPVVRRTAGRRGASVPAPPAAGRTLVTRDRVSFLTGGTLDRRLAFPFSISVAVEPAGTPGTARSSGMPSSAAFPSPSTISKPGYVEAQDVQGSGGCEGDKNWDSSSVTALGIGFQAWDSCIGVYQTYYVFDTTSVSTAWDILHMELNLSEVQGSWNACTGEPLEPVYLHSLGYNAGIGSDTDGSDVPTLGTSSLKDMLAPADNPNDNDGCSDQPASFDVTSYGGSIQGKANWTFGVNGDDTDNPNAGQFMRMSDNPTLVTTFDEYPAAPTMAQSSPAMVDNPATADTNYGCLSSSNGNPQIPWIGAASSVKLNASFSAPLSGEEVEPGWMVWNASATLVDQTYANAAAGAFPYSFTGPADGDEYFDEVWTTVNGNGGQGGYDPGETTQGPECSFAVDATPPAVPAVTSTAFPPSGSTPGTTQVAPGASGTFTFTSSDLPPSGCAASNPIAAAGYNGTADNCLASGVYEFEYSLNQPLSDGGVTPVTTSCPSGGVTSGAVAAVNPTGNPATNASANPGAATTGTSCPVNVSQWGTNILYVAAVDAAGNISQTYQYDFYVPWNPATPVKPGDINGDGQPDLMATDSSGDLVFFPGGTDPANGPVVASTPADSPDGNSWSDFIVTHRGSWSAGNTDDLLALEPCPGQPVGSTCASGSANLYRYNNSWNTHQWPAGAGATPTSPMFEVTSDIVTEFFPSCASIPSGDGGAGSANCTGYPAAAAGWSGFTQIIAPGDAWAGASSGSGITSDTGQPSLLAVTSGGELYLFQGSGGQLTNPVQLGSGDWNNVTVMAAGNVNGTDTIWARVNSGTDAGDIESFPLTVPSGQVPTLNASSPAAPPAATGGTTLVGSSGSPIQVPAGTFPTVTATGPLSASACPASTGDTRGCPGFFAEDTSGDMYYYPGQQTATAADALSGTSELVGDVDTGQNSGTIPSTGTVQLASNPGDYCVLTNVQNQGGGWRINTNNTVAGFYLNEGASFSLGSQVECWFANGMHEKLVLQGSDGNLVLYQYYSPQTWGAGTNGKSASVANFQTDGNFVVRNTSGTAIWSSGTHTYRDAVLVLQADGNLVIYQFPTATAPALWSTGTNVAALG